MNALQPFPAYNRDKAFVVGVVYSWLSNDSMKKFIVSSTRNDFIAKWIGFTSVLSYISNGYLVAEGYDNGYNSKRSNFYCVSTGIAYIAQLWLENQIEDNSTASTYARNVTLLFGLTVLVITATVFHIVLRNFEARRR